MGDVWSGGVAPALDLDDGGAAVFELRHGIANAGANVGGIANQILFRVDGHIVALYRFCEMHSCVQLSWAVKKHYTKV